MAKFKSGKKLWFSIAVIALTALLIVFNFSSFYGEDGIFGADSLIRCLAIFVAMSAILVTEITVPKKAENIAALLVFVFNPWLTLETVMLIIGIERYALNIYWLNVLFYAVLQIAIFFLTQSTRLSVCLTMAVSCALNIANEIVLLLRGTPLVPTDFYAISTAMKVTNSGEWRFNADMLAGFCAAVLLIALASEFKFEYPKKWVRPCAAAAAAAVLAAGCVGIYDIDYESFSTSTFDTESTNNVNGTALSFYINFRKMSFDKPENYSAEEIDEYLEKYEEPDYTGAVIPADGEADGESAGAEVIEPDYPNIIVIMNESFSDLSYLGRFRTDNQYMPYFNSLLKDYPNGRNLVSVLGGGTCNTEFEFLTGLSMMYMPANCYAYMQHVHGDVDSMASYLGSLGYQTVAMHPFYEVCWKRNSIYKFMGFDDFISGEDMANGEAGMYVSADRWEKGFGDDVEYIRTLISDSFFYKQVIDQFENKTSDRIFIFGVTVQNHSSYEYDGDDFETDVHILKPEGEFPRAEQYLSLIKDSDEALEELIEYFEGVDEKTMIVFFGDHQPNVEAEFIDAIAPDRNKFVNSYLTRFETPFVIWSNFDLNTGSKNLGVTSANYLGLKTLELAGIPLSPRYKLIAEAEDIAPAMATWGYYDKFGIWNDRQDTYKDEVLNVYNFYTYYQLNERNKK